jgi:malate:quinone-oxidoreductase
LEPAGIAWRFEQPLDYQKDEQRLSGQSDPQVAARADAVLIGAGIMSATLGALLRRLEPDWSITLVERLDAAGAESSGPWNNAGTGHSGLCELFYTPQQSDGSIDVSKAVRVNEQFQVTRQFWSYAAENGILPDVRGFLSPVPHVSFVQGAERVDYLRRRRQALAGNPLFARTEWIDDADEFARRLPLMAAKGRVRRTRRARLGRRRHRRRLRCSVSTVDRLRRAQRDNRVVR